MMPANMTLSYRDILLCVRYLGCEGTMAWLRPRPRPGTGARGRHQLGRYGRYILDHDGRPIPREVAA